MPMTSCPTCNRQVSDQASACPGCGHPLVSEAAIAREVVRFRILSAAIIVVGAVLLVSLSPGPVSNPANPLAVAAAQGFAPLRAVERGLAIAIVALGVALVLAARPLVRLKMWWHKR